MVPSVRGRELTFSRLIARGMLACEDCQSAPASIGKAIVRVRNTTTKTIFVLSEHTRKTRLRTPIKRRKNAARVAG
jgi:hypothetical protein